MGLAALTTIAMLAFGATLYGWMGGRGAALEAAVRYSTIVFTGRCAIYLLNIMSSVVRGAAT
jgi:Na+-driven multidrug efflux pump